MMKSKPKEREIIYIVDANPVNMKIAGNILEDKYDVHTFVSGDKMFNALRETTKDITTEPTKSKEPDLILIDISTPRTEGHEINVSLKKGKRYNHIPVVFMAASNDQKGVARAFNEGAFDCIQRPFTADIFVMRIDHHMLLQRQKRELDEAKKTTRTLNIIKSQFLPTLSHEMRTPLNTVVNLSRILLRDYRLCDETSKHVTNVHIAGRTLLYLVDDALDVSKMQAGTFELVPEDYDTANVISDALIQSLQHRGDKQIDFSLSINEKFPAKLHGDARRIRQILTNLLSNAFKYTEKGRVKLEIDGYIKGDAFSINVVVTDTGVGLSEEHLDSIFEEFVRVGTSPKEETEGTGLGLAIAKGLAQKMNGDITAYSRGIGEGCQFTAYFEQKNVSDESLGSEVIERLKNSSLYAQERLMQESFPTLELPGVKILVVDDAHANLEVARGMLEWYGITPHCVNSGKKAIRAIEIKKTEYDAIFMDFRMPGMDGIVTAHKIWGIDSQYARNIPIIAMTANAEGGNKEKFLKEGFKGFISKPIELNCLSEVLQECLPDKCKRIEKVLDDSVQVSLDDFHVDGIDVTKGLARFRGNANTYVNTLGMFMLDVLTFCEETGAMSVDDFEGYHTRVHGIKGSCKSICAEDSARIAEALENAADTKNHGFIDHYKATFAHGLQKLSADINNAIEKVISNVQKPQAIMPNKQLLERLFEACKRRESGDISTIVEKLVAYDYERGGDIVAALKKMESLMHYEEIIGMEDVVFKKYEEWCKQ